MKTRPTGVHRPAVIHVLILAGVLACSSSGDGSWSPGRPLTLGVGGTFPAGTVLRDHYTGKTATVAADGTVTVEPDANGVVLLERDGAASTPFRWKNATVYFVVTDRFENGDPTNDASYGRQPGGGAEVGAWHGGDLAGLTARLDHIQALGATAIWITPIVQQVRGWVGGGSGDFRHYGYHGYWALDFTRLDANLGSEADLQAFVDSAHARGIRVLLDVVMNHPGYATGDDLLEYLPEVFFDGTGDAFRSFQPFDSRGWQAWNDLVNYTGTTAWVSWWGPPWIRAGLGGYTTCTVGCSDQTRQLTFLPDFKTESATAAGFPPLLARKALVDGTDAVEIPGATVRDYLVGWHADWVRRFGFDGFRCDTAKNVELDSWAALKQASLAALAEWKAANPAKKIDDAPFWTTGEVFPHGVEKDDYYTLGAFDSLLNFGFQPALESLLVQSASLVERADDLDGIYATYATALAPDPSFDALTYVSSHDTKLFFAAMGYDPARQQQAGTALLLAPGGVQIFYGDETGRRLGPSVSDALQGTRSDMNWSSTDGSILEHWQKLGTFRKRHAAIGAGTHERLASPGGTYAFARRLDDGVAQDAAVVVLTL